MLFSLPSYLSELPASRDTLAVLKVPLGLSVDRIFFQPVLHSDQKKEICIFEAGNLHDFLWVPVGKMWTLLLTAGVGLKPDTNIFVLWVPAPLLFRSFVSNFQHKCSLTLSAVPVLLSTISRHYERYQVPGVTPTPRAKKPKKSRDKRRDKSKRSKRREKSRDRDQ